jgi:hypothetical protein
MDVFCKLFNRQEGSTTTEREKEKEEMKDSVKPMMQPIIREPPRKGTSNGVTVKIDVQIKREAKIAYDSVCMIDECFDVSFRWAVFALISVSLLFFSSFFMYLNV